MCIFNYIYWIYIYQNVFLYLFKDLEEHNLSIEQKKINNIKIEIIHFTFNGLKIKKNIKIDFFWLMLNVVSILFLKFIFIFREIFKINCYLILIFF